MICSWCWFIHPATAISTNRNGSRTLGIVSSLSRDLRTAVTPVHAPSSFRTIRDGTGSYVFEVEPEAVSQSWGRTSHFWQVGAGTDTMYSVWNPSPQPEDLDVGVYYGQAGGVYHYPLHLEPNASAMISMMDLIHKGVPDYNGSV